MHLRISKELKMNKSTNNPRNRDINIEVSKCWLGNFYGRPCIILNIWKRGENTKGKITIDIPNSSVCPPRLPLLSVYHSHENLFSSQLSKQQKIMKTNFQISIILFPTTSLNWKNGRSISTYRSARGQFRWHGYFFAQVNPNKTHVQKRLTENQFA